MSQYPSFVLFFIYHYLVISTLFLFHNISCRNTKHDSRDTPLKSSSWTEFPYSYNTNKSLNGQSEYWCMTLRFFANKSICCTSDIINHPNVAFIMMLVVCHLSQVECNQNRIPQCCAWPDLKRDIALFFHSFCIVSWQLWGKIELYWPPSLYLE